MAIEDIELDVGGTKFKGVYLAILFSFASTIGGGIWAASEFFSRLEQLEETVMQAEADSATTNQRFDDFREVWVDEKKTMTADISVAQQQIQDAGIPELQGKLATLGTNLETILERQRELLEIQDRIVAVEKNMGENNIIIEQTEEVIEDAKKLDGRIKQIEREIEDIWKGLDYLSNPYGN